MKSLRACPNCGTQVPQQDTRCSHCRFNFPLTESAKVFHRIVWLCLGVVVLILVLWPRQPKDVPLTFVKRGPEADLPNPSREASPIPASPVKSEPEPADLELLNPECFTRTANCGSKHIDLTDGVIAIVGKVRNNSDKTYRYVSIRFSLYDKSGAQVGTALAGISGLNALGTWKFRAVVAEKDAANFELQKLSGF